MGESTARESVKVLDEALSGLQATASNFAHVCIRDSLVRTQYMRDIAEMAQEFTQAIDTGKLSPIAAAEQVRDLRNEILKLSRARTSPIGLAYAMKLKRTGRTMAELTDKYAARLFGRPFANLSEAQQAQVYSEIVRAAGRPDMQVAALAEKLGRVGRRLFLVALAVAAYEIYQAEDKSSEAIRQGAIAGAGVLGGATIGAGSVAAGFCAATAPVCVSVAALIGGILFAQGADLLVGTVYPFPSAARY